jgi:hypothetical protein
MIADVEKSQSPLLLGEVFEQPPASLDGCQSATGCTSITGISSIVIVLAAA